MLWNLSKLFFSWNSIEIYMNLPKICHSHKEHAMKKFQFFFSWNSIEIYMNLPKICHNHKEHAMKLKQIFIYIYSLFAINYSWISQVAYWKDFI